MATDSDISDDLSSSEISPDSNKFQLVIENFAEVIAEDNFFINQVVGFVACRSIELIVHKHLSETEYLQVYLRHNAEDESLEDDPIKAVNMKYRIWIGDSEELSYTEKCVEMETNKLRGWWKRATVEQVLSGYLEENGSLIINCEVSIEGMRMKDGVGLFNYFDPFEQCLTISSDQWDESFYVNKQLFLHHCKRFTNDPEAIEGHIHLRHYSDDDIQVFLQFLNGVHLATEARDWSVRRAFILATWLKADNVLRLIDYETLPNGCIQSFSEECTSFGTNELFVKWIVNTAENTYRLKQYLSYTEWETVEGELLKTLAKKFFSFAVSPMVVNKSINE